MYRQMNEMVWVCDKQDYLAKLRYKNGPLTVSLFSRSSPTRLYKCRCPQATIATFIPGKVRIVQATCNPSDKLPRLTLTLRAIYNLGHDNYNKNSAYDVMKWILTPPEAQLDKELAIRGKK
jgi:hypothetical protein